MKGIAIAVGLLTGIISGFGIGGGSLLVLYLTAVAGVEQYTAAGINLLYFLACAPMALITHIRQKRVEWQAVIWCVAVGAIVSAVASYFAAEIPTDLLRRLFGVLVIYVGIKELFCNNKNPTRRRN